MSDFRDAWRALRATPLVSTVAIVSLALGIGANAAMFSLVDALVLRGLPVRHADRLTMLFDDVGRASFWSHPVWESIQRRPELSDGAFAFSGFRANLSPAGEVDPADGLFATGRMFEVMGVDAALGRTFNEADDVIGGGPDGPVAVISHGFWQRRFGGAENVIGRRITLDQATFTIIGVTGPRFFGPEVGRAFDVAIPISTEPLVRGTRSGLGARGSSWLQIMFRLAPGQTPKQATAAFRAVQPLIRDETMPANLRPEDQARHLANPLTIRPGSTVSGVRDQYEKPLFALMGIVALTLLIACGNIANLLLARATARRHELSVRSALGASAGRLGRQLLSESVLLSAIGATLGVVVAVVGSRFLVAQLSMTTNRIFNRVFIDVGIDWRMLSFTAAVGIATALLFGVAPALRSARVAPIDAMKEQGRGTSARGGIAGSLVMVQVAISLVLLIGAGLFVRTFATLSNKDLGLDRDGIAVVDINSEQAVSDSVARLAMYERIVEVARALPEVSGAALSSITPVSGTNTTRRMIRVGMAPLPEADRRTWLNVISPGWFSTMGTRIVAGRDFDQRDRAGAMRAVIVNETFARKHFGNESPLGQLIVEEPASFANPAPLEIVGVVEDAAYRSVREPVPPTMYWAIAQQARPPLTLALMVRARTGAITSVSRGAIEAVARVNPNLTTSVRPFSDIVDAALARERLVARLSAFFGILALILAALGLYGVTSYSVQRRHTELGIRMALGTTPTAVVGIVLRRVGLLAAGGLVAGALVSWWATKFTSALLYDLTPRDVPTIIGAMLILATVAGFAGWLPARRAARIDPAQVLRNT